eukprot:4707674-Pleurochrysis_carterae.AAC.1
MLFACHEYSYGALYQDKKTGKWTTTKQCADTQERWRAIMIACTTFEAGTNTPKMQFVVEGRVTCKEYFCAAY